MLDTERKEKDMSKLVNLSWNEFQSCTRDAFHSLMEDTHFTDVTLVCEDDKQVKAHKIILSSCSSFFNKILTKNPTGNLLIYLKGIRYTELRAILNFIYLGKTSVKEDELEYFMIAAKELEIKELYWDFFQTKDAEQTFNSEDQTANQAPENFLTNASINTEEPLGKYDATQNEKDTFSNDAYGELYEEFNQYRKRESEKIKCDQCKYRAGKPSLLKQHKLKVHSGPGYKCDQCEKTFKTSAMCKEHTEIVHIAVEYPCNLCKYTTKSLNMMRLHKESIHF